MNRRTNDDITPIFDWLYIGGVRNTRKTLPLVDVWYDFKWDTREPKNLKIPDNIIVHRIPFDDGNLEQAIPVWEKCRKDILKYKEEGKTIFVSCYEGLSRSAVLCLWLACEELGDYEKALIHVKQCRKIYPDRNFHPFLETLKKNYKK